MVCFVILHYIAVDETITCVDSILNNVHGESKIIVVDNDSPNNSFDKLCMEYKNNSKVDVLKTDSNIGFARGNNFGYCYAVRRYKPDFIVVMNNDMEIKQHDFIEGIETCYSKYRFFVMGPDIYSTKKEYHQNPQTRVLPSKKELRHNYIKLQIKKEFPVLVAAKWKFKEFFGKTDYDVNYYKNIPYIDYVVENKMLHGSCYIFSPLFIYSHEEGCFYDKTFMYLEAEILYYQCINRGEKIIYYPYLKVFHHEDVSTDARFDTQYKKSMFSINCLAQSTRAFMDLMDE